MVWNAHKDPHYRNVYSRGVDKPHWLGGPVPSRIDAEKVAKRPVLYRIKVYPKQQKAPRDWPMHTNPTIVSVGLVFVLIMIFGIVALLREIFFT